MTRIMSDVITQQHFGTVRLGITPKRAHQSGIRYVFGFSTLKIRKFVTVTLSLDGGIEHPLVVRILEMDIPESSKCFIDEDQTNHNGEDLLSESGEETSDGTGVQAHQNNHENQCPHSDPESEFQEWNALHPTKVRDDSLEYESGACWAEIDKRLAREDGIDEVTDTNSQNGLRSTLRTKEKYFRRTLIILTTPL